MIHYDDPTLQYIEGEINYIYHKDVTGYPEREFLLDIRQRLLNDQALTHESQEELLPHIIAFNDALRDALKHMYDRAHELYRQMSAIQPEVELTAICWLAYDYPSLHPYKGEDRQDLFDAICDSGWNPMYESGVTIGPLRLPRDINDTFDTLIGMDCPPPNWNEGLNSELTKDLHLTNAFHHLFCHTNFALTDFIYIRDFNIEYNLSFKEAISDKKI